MTYADTLEKLVSDALESLWRSVKAMPEDKLTWRPEAECRTALELLEELAMTTAYCAKLIELKKNPEMPEGVAAYLAAVKAFPEAELSETIDLPWGKNTFFQTISYPYWNLVYHWGQINYIQTMYGDKQMP